MPITDYTVKMLKKMMRSRGVRGYSKLRKAELYKHLFPYDGNTKVVDTKGGGMRATNKKKINKKKYTVKILKKMARERGLKGYSKLRKAELIQLVFDKDDTAKPDPRMDDHTLRTLQHVASQKNMRGYTGMRKKELFDRLMNTHVKINLEKDYSSYYANMASVYGNCVANLFNQVGMIVNEYVPEYYHSNLFRRDHVFSIYDSVSLRSYSKCSDFFTTISLKYKNLRALNTPHIYEGNFQIFKKFKHLHTLHLPSYRYNVCDEVNQLTKLVELSLGTINYDIKQDFLSQLSNLRVLKLPNLVSKTSFLRHLPKLEKLCLFLFDPSFMDDIRQYTIMNPGLKLLLPDSLLYEFNLII